MGEDSAHFAGQGHFGRDPSSSGIAGVTYTPRDLMELFGVSENTIYRELQYGCLKSIAFRVGRQWRCGANALERLIAGRMD